MILGIYVFGFSKFFGFIVGLIHSAQNKIEPEAVTYPTAAE
jgi:hypothetical protein